MPRLVNQKSLEAVFAELPNQFTLKELKIAAAKHKLNSATVVRQGKARKVFVSLEYGVYSRIKKLNDPAVLSPTPRLEVAETVRHLGFVVEGNTGAFPLPVFHVQHRLITNISPVTPEIQKSLKALEEEVLQLRMDIADALVEPSDVDIKMSAGVNVKATTPKELRALAEAYGWEYKRQTGSHHIFKHPGRPDPLSIPNANSNKSIGARASRLIQTQILRGTKGQKPHKG